MKDPMGKGENRYKSEVKNHKTKGLNQIIPLPGGARGGFHLNTRKIRTFTE
jgi:hypothetical protein